MHAHHGKDNRSEKVAEVAEDAEVVEDKEVVEVAEITEITHIPRFRSANRNAIYGGIRTSDGSLVVLNDDLSIPKIVVHPPSHNDRYTTSTEGIQSVYSESAPPMNQEQWFTPAPRGYYMTEEIKNRQSDDDKGSVFSFEEGDDQVPDLRTVGVHEIHQIKPLKINRKSVAQSEMAVFEYAEDPVEVVARESSIAPTRPLGHVIHELRSDDPSFQSKLGGVFPESDSDTHASLSSNSLLAEPSRFSIFAEDAMFDIDNMIEMYSSLTDLDDPYVDGPGASSKTAPIQRHNSVSTTSSSCYGDVIDPSIKVQRSYDASSNDMAPLSTETYLSPPSPDRSSRQLAARNYHRYPPRFDSLNPFQYSESEIAYLRAEQALLTSVGAIPPPIPERSPARLRARTTKPSLPDSTTGM